MKILSWNLYNLYNTQDFLADEIFVSEREAALYIEKRNKYFVDTIRAIAPHICFFYEVKSIETLEAIAKEVYTEGYHIFTGSADRRGICNAVVYTKRLEHKVQVEEVLMHDLELPLFQIDEAPLRNKYLAQKRGHIQVCFDDFVLYGVHLKAQLPSNIKQSDGEDYAVTTSVLAAHAQVLGEFIALAEGYGLRKRFSRDIAENKKVIAVGDYNCEARSGRYKILQGLYTAPDYMQSLFSEYTESEYSHIYKTHKVRLDHVLMSSGAAPKIKNELMHTECVYEKREYTWHDTAIIGSDHGPIEFEIEE